MTVPELSRRHAAGAESARGLLFTVLGEFVLPHGGTAWTSAVVELLGRLGVEEKAARQALMRTGADGWLTSSRVGRRSVWQLTPRAEQLLVEGTERIYGFTASAPSWDGSLLLVLARVPESDRAARHLLRTRLRWAGFGSPSPGVWISTHPERLGDVEALFAQSPALADGRVFVSRYSGGAPLASLAAQAWDLDALAAEYRSFLSAFASARAADPLARVVELVHAWRAFPWSDPVLPGELLPSGWAGERAAALFARRHSAWSARAQQEWLRLNA